MSISSAGKTFSLTGWKIGWVTGPAALVAAVRTAKQFLTYVSGGPFQYAVAEALALPDAVLRRTCAPDLRRKRDLLAGGLREAGFEVFQPDGTYFITTDISGLSDEDGLAFCRSMPERCGVVAIPNQVFYDDAAAARHLVRFAFCKKDEVLRRGRGTAAPASGRARRGSSTAAGRGPSVAHAYLSGHASIGHPSLTPDPVRAPSGVSRRASRTGWPGSVPS